MIDIHTHTHHSPDGIGSMMTMAEHAEKAGLSGITFTDHAEWYPGDEAYGYLNLEAYFHELEHVRAAYGHRLSLLAGVELGNPHDFTGSVSHMLQQWPFDLVIGSVHWMDDLPGWEPEIFQQGIDATYQRYFDEVVTMVDRADFDVLGHLDLVRRDSWELFRQVLDLEPYLATIDRALCRLIEAGKGVEINTSALRKGLSEPVPGLEVLRRYRELGGDILVFGSDGHRPAHVGYGFDVARDLALAAGFERVARYERRLVVGWIDLV